MGGFVYCCCLFSGFQISQLHGVSVVTRSLHLIHDRSARISGAFRYRRESKVVMRWLLRNAGNAKESRG